MGVAAPCSLCGSVALCTALSWRPLWLSAVVAAVGMFDGLGFVPGMTWAGGGGGGGRRSSSASCAWGRGECEAVVCLAEEQVSQSQVLGRYLARQRRVSL